MHGPALRGHLIVHSAPARASRRSTSALGLVKAAMRKLAITIAFLLLVMGALVLTDRSENPTREYDAMSEEVFSGGWVPKALPADASGIKVQNNLDTNEVWVRFAFGSSSYSPSQFGFRA